MKNNKISPGEGRVQEQGGLSSNITFCGRDSFQCNQTGCTVSGDSLMKPAGWKWWWHEWRRVYFACQESSSQVVTPNKQCDDSQSSWGRQGDFSRFESKHNNILSTKTLEESALVRDGHDSHVTVQTLDSWREVLGETCYLCLTL